MILNFLKSAAKKYRILNETLTRRTLSNPFGYIVSQAVNISLKQLVPAFLEIKFRFWPLTKYTNCHFNDGQTENALQILLSKRLLYVVSQLNIMVCIQVHVEILGKKTLSFIC